jgi:hypothetical protein
MMETADRSSAVSSRHWPCPRSLQASAGINVPDAILIGRFSVIAEGKQQFESKRAFSFLNIPNGETKPAFRIICCASRIVHLYQSTSPYDPYQS